MQNGNWRINRSPSMTYEAKKKKYQEKRNEIFNLLGAYCKKCGFDDKRALQIDHINGGGSKERNKTSGTTMLYHILKKLEEYQVLCANCNWIKRHAENEQPIGKRIMCIKG